MCSTVHQVPATQASLWQEPHQSMPLAPEDPAVNPAAQPASVRWVEFILKMQKLQHPPGHITVHLPCSSGSSLTPMSSSGQKSIWGIQIGLLPPDQRHNTHLSSSRGLHTYSHTSRQNPENRESCCVSELFHLERKKERIGHPRAPGNR